MADLSDKHLELLVRIDERVMATDAKVDGINKRLDVQNGTVKDNTKRILCLENWRWYVLGIGTTIMVVGGLLLKYKVI